MVLAKLNSSTRKNYSAEISATPQTFNVARNLSRMPLVTALQNDQIDLSQQSFIFSERSGTKLVIDNDGGQDTAGMLSLYCILCSWH